MNVVEAAIADYLGVVLLICMMISSRIRRSDEEHMEFRVFTAITIITMIACVVDFFVFFSDGKSGALMKFLNVFGNTFCYIANPILIASWCLYEDLKLYHSPARIKNFYIYVFIPAIFMCIIAIVNNAYPIIYTIDENNVYKRLTFSYIYYAVDIFYILFSIYILKSFEQRYGKVRFFPLYLMVGPVVLGYTLQMLFYGTSVVWVSVAVGLTAIYMSFQNEFSYLDKLTGLYNRAYLDYQLESVFKDKAPNLGGIMIDVDHFKSINDTFGHSVGDEALIDVARIINFSKPDKAIATRFAGDEFIILVRDTRDKELQRIIRNLRDETYIFNDTENRRYKLSLSMGYSIFDTSNETIDDFLRHMDDNMYEEKEIRHRTENK